MAIEVKKLIHENDFSGLKMFGEVEKAYDYNTKAHNGFKISVIVMDPSSPLYLENIQLKVKTNNPTFKDLESYSNKLTDVELVGLNVGIFNNKLIFNSEDIKKQANSTKS